MRFRPAVRRARLVAASVLLTSALGAVGDTAEVARADSPAGAYHALPVTRVIDSRTGLGVAKGPKSGSVVLTMPSSVPQGALSAMLDVSVVGPSADGFLRVAARGSASSATAMTFQRGASATGLVQTALSAQRQATISVAGGPTHLVVDVLGYYIGGSQTGGRYVSVPGARFVDSRQGLGISKGPQSGTHTLTLPGNVPATAEGVLLNVSVVGPRSAGYARLASDAASGGATILTYPARVSLTGLSLTRPASDGSVVLTLAGGAADVVVDLVGYYTSASDTAGPAGAFLAIAPHRVADSRTGLGITKAHRGGFLFVSPGSSVPTNESGVVLSVTIVKPQADGFLRVAAAAAQAVGTVMNYRAGRDQTQLVFVLGAPDGRLALTLVGGLADVVVDVVGYHTADAPPATPPAGPGCTLSVSNPSPKAGSRVGVTMQSVAESSTVLVGHFPGSDVASAGATDAQGAFTRVFPTGSTRNTTVTIEGAADKSGGESYCSVTFKTLPS